MLDDLSNTVGAYEAKTHFSELLERVEKGEELTITRHGQPVARMVPVRAKASAAKRREAIDAIRRLSRGNSLGNVSIKDLLTEGRR